ncbi:unnamed protein product, partial [Cladocopium goreaui]
MDTPEKRPRMKAADRPWAELSDHLVRGNWLLQSPPPLPPPQDDPPVTPVKRKHCNAESAPELPMPIKAEPQRQGQ